MLEVVCAGKIDLKNAYSHDRKRHTMICIYGWRTGRRSYCLIRRLGGSFSGAIFRGFCGKTTRNGVILKRERMGNGAGRHFIVADLCDIR